MEEWRRPVNFSGTTKVFCSVMAALLLAAAAPLRSSAREPWMNTSLSASQRADLLLRAMTLTTRSRWFTALSQNRSKDMSDTSRRIRGWGFRRSSSPTAAPGSATSAKDVTLLPAPLPPRPVGIRDLLNYYWNVSSARSSGGKGTNVALGPTIDVVRVPEWGRTFESYGEDPYFNGQMAAAEIKGIQSRGTHCGCQHVSDHEPGRQPGQDQLGRG